MSRVLILIVTLFSGFSAFANLIIKADHVKVQLIKASNPDPKKLSLGVHFKIDPEWHVYWKNPGDSGAAPKFNLTGGSIEEIKWPYPHRLPVGHLTNYGYDGEVVFILEVSPQKDEMILNLEWLVCKVECIPGFGEFKFTKASLTTDQVLFDKYLARVPQSTNEWNVKLEDRNEQVFEFTLTPKNLALSELKNIFVYPENGELFKTELPLIDLQKNSINIAVPLTNSGNSQTDKANFTFVIEKINGEIDSFTQSVDSQKPQNSWLMGLLLAFLGGVILNLMPCVFPVLFLKAFGFLKETDPQKIRSSSNAYSAGVVLSFFAIGAILTALRYSGEAIGWGFQLQSPWVVYALALLFFVMALNFYGYFEMGNTAAYKAGSLLNHKFFSGSFGTGVLAVIVASPCTAPFMGSALGLTLLLPAYQSLLIFVALGMGMALPMMMLGYMPWLVRKLPRAGQWMITVKQLLSFPLFATCIWLLWVLSQQKGSDGVIISITSFLVVVFALWLLQSTRKFVFKLIAVLLLGTPILAAAFISKSATISNSATSNPSDQKVNSVWAPFDEKVITQKRQDQPVFVDFITCQVNKRAVLDTEEIQNLFREKNVFLVRADWTNHDPQITMALAQFGRNSVPFYVYYNKLEKAQTLPELLTKDMIKQLLEGDKK
ncbi:MAG: protein-disulfide reductase DsbD domain-containing protein [Bdellovibrionota bacterium]